MKQQTLRSTRLAAAMIGLLNLMGNAHGGSPSPTAVWTLDGFAEPESVVLDRQHDRLIVSNIAGHPGQSDGEGFLSLVDLDGRMVEREWVSGFDAPKGMAISGGLLYVSDLTRLHAIDLASGAVVDTHVVDDASFLNDVTATEDGNVFVTDMMAEAVYRLHEGRVERWIEDERLHHPNGILSYHDHLIVGNWGEGLQADFTTMSPGGLLALMAADRRGISLEPIAGAMGLGNIDGIVSLPAGFLISDWVKGSLLLVPHDGGATREFPLKAGIADIGAGDGRVYVPFMHDGRIGAYEYEQFKH